MGACHSLAFTGVAPNVWECLVQELHDKTGITISGDSGSASAKGFTFRWQWDGENSLMIQCTDSPWYVPCGTINDEASSLVKACGAESV